MIGISSSYSFPKAVVAIVQTVYAAITLYQSRGSQIQIYGYAAFGLTVTPYIVMSIVNLIAALATPDYDALFLVRSEIMDEAEKRGGVFDGLVGKLIHDDILEPDPRCLPPGIVRQKAADKPMLLISHGSGNQAPDPSIENLTPSDTVVEIRKYEPKHADKKDEAKEYKSWVYVPACGKFRRSRSITEDTVFPPADSREYASKELRHDRADVGYKEKDTPDRKHEALSGFFIPLGISLISILVIGILSHFAAGQSTRAERGWTMAWLVTGMVVAPMSPGLVGIYIDGLLDQWDESLEKGENPLGILWMSLFSLVCYMACTGVFFAPGVGGLVVVGQEIRAYGSCTRVD
jgi:hypothetical protein